LTQLATDAHVLVNAVNPTSYTRWAREWPPMSAAFLTAAARTGAGLLTVSNLYGYGPQPGVLSESTPLAATGTKGRVRAQMWEDALAAHRRGEVRTTEVRASDYFGADSRRQMSFLNDFLLRPLAAGKVARPPMGNLDAPHSWTYLPDISRLAAALADRVADDAIWGRAWHVPTAPARSLREVAGDLAALGLVDSPRVRLMPRSLMRLARVVPLIGELEETAYQFERPFVLDSQAAQRELGLAPTPWADALTETWQGFAGTSGGGVIAA
ncbi:MAG: NAD-dependent epimerase, partial [Nocardioides sp.]